MMDQQSEGLMDLSLGEKMEHSKDVIKEAITRFSRDRLFLAWTGGKDSTTMLLSLIHI